MSNPKARRQNPGHSFNFMKRAPLIAGILVVILIFILCALPLPTPLRKDVVAESTQILDRTGELLYEVQGEGMRLRVPFDSIPPAINDALIATEDRTFYAHPGLSLRGITRAAIRDIKAGKIVEGGSTITQQLVRVLLRPKQRGFAYKIREAWLALKYDALFSKEQILERYVNTAYFGQGAYGIRAAAKVYFDSDIQTLSVGQSAMLIGLLNAPTALNPFSDPNAAKKRRDLVLRAMRTEDYISQEEFLSATAEEIRLTSSRTKIRAPHFVLWMLDTHPELRNQKTVRTTIDLDLQSVSEQIVDRQLEKLKEKNVTAAAVVVLDAKTGDILTMIGSRDYFDSDHDGAVNVAISPRQPGSALKPFTYALALSQGMTAASTISDIETQFFTAEGNPYVPRNYDYGYHGLVRLREALANSYNIAAVRVLERVGVDRLLAFLRLIGFSTLTESPEHYGLALTLGDSEVKLLELTSAYGIFLREGTTIHPRSFQNEVIPANSKILDAKVAWLIADILSDTDARTAEFGRDGPLEFSYQVAAKTGTTRNSRDNWTVGFSSDRIVGVWVGNADNSPMRGTSGVTGAGPIFHDVMEAAMRYSEKDPFKRPEGIVDRVLCRLSGKIATPLCTEIITEHFISGTEPRETDDMFVSIDIDTRNGLRAGEQCPKEFTQKKTFIVFPLETRKWAKENGYPSPPDAFSPLCPSRSTEKEREESSVTITRPAPGSSFLLDPLIPDENELIVFEARSDQKSETLSWFINNQKVGEGRAPNYRFTWKPVPGIFTIRAGSGAIQNTVRIEIRQ